MTASDMVHALIRRWYVVLAWIACAVLVTGSVFTQPGVYWSRTQVQFLAPSSADFPNSLKTRSSDLIITAGVVAKLINEGQERVKMTSPEVTIFGEGVREGFEVSLPDDGGQWSISYQRQMLDVQVVGPTAVAVRQQQDILLQDISDKLADLQVEVAPVNRISAKVVPVTPSVVHVTGDRRRAALMVVVLCGTGALVSVYALEMRARRRRARERPAPES